MSEEMNLGSNQKFQEGDIVKGVAEQVEEKSVTVSIEGHLSTGLYLLANFQAYTLKKLLI